MSIQDKGGNSGNYCVFGILKKVIIILKMNSLAVKVNMGDS